MKAHIIVTPKPSVFDPQGEAVRRALHGWGLDKLTSVRIGKFIEVELEPGDADAYRKLLENASADLLSNPVIENYKLHLHIPAGEDHPDGLVREPAAAFGGASAQMVQRWEGEGGHSNGQPAVPEEDAALAAKAKKGKKRDDKKEKAPAKKVTGGEIAVGRWEAEGGNPEPEEGAKKKKKDKPAPAPVVTKASAKPVANAGKAWPKSKKA